jgi:hypothetical protein
LDHARQGLNRRVDAPEITSCEDCEDNVDRSVRQPLILPGTICIGSPEPYSGFRIVYVSSHDASTCERLGIPLDLLISKLLLESRFPKEIRSNKLVTDAVE